MDTKKIMKDLGSSILRIVPPSEPTASELAAQLKRAGSDKTLIVGIGGSGSQLLKKVYEQHALNADLRFLAINSDYKELGLLAKAGIELLELKRAVPQVRVADSEGAPRDLSMFNGQGAGGDPTVGQRMMHENMDQFVKKFSTLESELGGEDSHFCRVILLYGYGGGTGAGASQVIAEKLKELYPYLELYGIVVTPRMSGSEERMREIVESVQLMEKYVRVFFPVDQEGMYRAYGNLTQAEASAKFYEVALKTVNAFLLVIGVPVEKNIDAADLARGLGGSNIDEDAYGQCAIAGYVEGKIEDLPEVQGLDKGEGSDLLHLLYTAVPGEFMFLRDVRGARNCIIKIVYGEGVNPSMNDFGVLEQRVRALVGATASNFTPLIGYGHSPLVEKGEYKFAVFFSQFQDDNAMTLSARINNDYEEWKAEMDGELRQPSEEKVLEFNTYRRPSSASKRIKHSTTASVESAKAVASHLEVYSGEAKEGMYENVSRSFPIANVAQTATAVIAPIVEATEGAMKKSRRKVAAAEMESMIVSKEVGQPMQRRLDLTEREEVDTPSDSSTAAYDPMQAMEIWMKRNAKNQE